MPTGVICGAKGGLRGCPLVGTIYLVILRRFFFYRKSFPIDHGNRSSKGVGIKLQVTSTHHMCSSLQDNLIVSRPLGGKMLRRLNVRRQDGVVFNRRFVRRLLPTTHSTRNSAIVRGFLPLLIFRCQREFVQPTRCEELVLFSLVHGKYFCVERLRTL